MLKFIFKGVGKNVDNDVKRVTQDAENTFVKGYYYLFSQIEQTDVSEEFNITVEDYDATTGIKKLEKRLEVDKKFWGELTDIEQRARKSKIDHNDKVKLLTVIKLREVTVLEDILTNEHVKGKGLKQVLQGINFAQLASLYNTVNKGQYTVNSLACSTCAYLDLAIEFFRVANKNNVTHIVDRCKTVKTKDLCFYAANSFKKSLKALSKIDLEQKREEIKLKIPEIVCNKVSQENYNRLIDDQDFIHNFRYTKKRFKKETNNKSMVFLAEEAKHYQPVIK